MLNLSALCTAQGLVRLSFGTVDFQVDAGIDGDREELDAARMMLVLHSKAAGLQAPVDGVSTNLADEAGLADDAKRSRRFGFGGKLCVHPKQVAVVNAAFAPDPSAVAWAARVMAALSTGGHGAVAVDGKLIDKPIIDRARLVLAANAAYAAPA
jgi:citrate lyase subunit beta/citryl-CoA lyase